MATMMVLVLAAGTAMAADGIKDRMLARIPALNTLKTQGVVGENNKGYLEVVGGKSGVPVSVVANASAEESAGGGYLAMIDHVVTTLLTGEVP